MKVRNLSDSAKRFVQRAAAATTDYQQQATAAAQDWASKAGAAAPNYQAGVQAAIGEGRYQAGVSRAGAQKYSKGISEKGAARYGPGVAVAESDWQTGFQPYAQALESTSLPPRKPRRDPGNLQRVAAVVNAMIQAAKSRK